MNAYKVITIQGIVEEIGEDVFFGKMLEWKLGGKPAVIEGYSDESWYELYWKFKDSFDSWLLLHIWKKLDNWEKPKW